MSRQVYLLGVGMLLVTGALVVTDHALTPPPGMTEANLHRIQKGMTLPQVERILGGPPTGQTIGVMAGGPGTWKVWRWAGPDWEASVWFNADGRVDWVARCDPKTGTGVAVETTDPLGPIRSWLGQ